MPWRRLGVLIRQLPPTSRTMRALYPHHEWSTEAHLLALAVDALRGANWQRSADPKHPTPPPDPIERPGVTVKAKGLTIEELGRRRRLAEQAALEGRVAEGGSVDVG